MKIVAALRDGSRSLPRPHRRRSRLQPSPEPRRIETEIVVAPDRRTSVRTTRACRRCERGRCDRPPPRQLLQSTPRSALRRVRTRRSRGAYIKTRSTSGRRPRMRRRAAADDHAVAARGILAHRACTAASNSSSKAARSKKLGEFRRRALEAVQEPLAKRCAVNLRLASTASDGNAQARGNHNRKLAVDVIVSRVRAATRCATATAPEPYSFEIVTITGERATQWRIAGLPADHRSARPAQSLSHASNARPGPSGALRTLFSRALRGTRRGRTASTCRVEAGELVGYIGPNGAGKSTTIKMLTGILVPDLGRGRASPGSCHGSSRKENARNIGVVFGQRSQLYWDLPLIESFELLRAIYGVPPRSYRRNLDEFMEMLEMDEFIRTPVRQLSLGQRMRGDFAAAMLHDPQDRVPRRADDRAGRRRQGGHPRVHRAHQRRARHDDHPDDARSGRRRTALPAHRLIDHGTLIYDGDVDRIKSEYGRFRTLVVRFSEPVAHPASGRRRAGRHRRFDRALSLRPQPAAGGSAGSASERTLQRRRRESWRSRISSRSSGESTSRDTKADAGGRAMILSSGTKKPKIHSSAYVAPTATICGDVTIGAGCACCTGRSSSRRARR